jgi:DNA-binding XRE family transcriptional regulator
MDKTPKHPQGRKQHAPTDAQRQLVQLHATVGTTQDMIARVIGIDKKTLRLHYRDELDLSMAKANATIGGALFNKAKAGDTTSMTFWLKTRARWRETSDVNLISEDGSMSPKAALDVSRLSPEALAEIVALGDATDTD